MLLIFFFLSKTIISFLFHNNNKHGSQVWGLGQILELCGHLNNDAKNLNFMWSGLSWIAVLYFFFWQLVLNVKKIFRIIVVAKTLYSPEKFFYRMYKVLWMHKLNVPTVPPLAFSKYCNSSKSKSCDYSGQVLFKRPFSKHPNLQDVQCYTYRLMYSHF